MKTRNGFVSNSSSSSFLVFSGGHTCRYTGLDLFNILTEILESSYSDDDSFEINNIEQYINNLKENIKILEVKLEEYKSFNPEKVYESGVGYKITYGHKAKWKQEELDRVIELLSKIEKQTGKWATNISHIEISYHNKNANKIFEELCKQKIVEKI